MSEENKFPRVLVISHNALSTTGNMGKTMADLLSCVPADNMAQLFFHNDTPDADCNCGRYFRVTDVNMVKSVFSRKAGYKIYTKATLAAKADATSGKKTSGAVHRIYQFSRRRTPFIYTARNLLWSVGVWNSKALQSWIEDFSPDVIFFAAGDYAFAYKIVHAIAQKQGIKVVPWFGDDFYLRQLAPKQIFQKLVRNNLKKWAKKVFAVSDIVTTISDKMAADYAEHFGVKTQVVRISATAPQNSTQSSQRQGIYYIGNLGVNRFAPLMQFAQQLHSADIPGLEHIHVYSGEKNQNTLDMLKNAEGIVFHGAVAPEVVQQLQAEAKYLLHTESFGQQYKNRTRYSLSTKIAEYLASGACIVAYGPDDIASMEYLKQGSAALVSQDAQQLVQLIKDAQNNPQLYSQTVANAQLMAQTHHNPHTNNKKMKEILLSSARQPAGI